MIPSALTDLYERIARPPGAGRAERTSHECTVCGTTFDVAGASCPSCGSRIYRARTRTPDAELTLLVVVVVAGLEMAYNLVTGQYPKEGPGA